MNLSSILLLIFVVMLPCGIVVGLAGAMIRHYLLENHPLMLNSTVEWLVNGTMLLCSALIVTALYFIFN